MGVTVLAVPPLDAQVQHLRRTTVAHTTVAGQTRQHLSQPPTMLAVTTPTVLVATLPHRILLPTTMVGMVQIMVVTMVQIMVVTMVQVTLRLRLCCPQQMVRAQEHAMVTRAITTKQWGIHAMSS
jgi:hypothetical protein